MYEQPTHSRTDHQAIYWTIGKVQKNNKSEMAQKKNPKNYAFSVMTCLHDKTADYFRAGELRGLVWIVP